MPNHVTNRITGPSEVVSALVNEDGNFDFNQLIPTPECVVTDSLDMTVELVAEIALGLIDFNEPQRMPIDPMANMRAAAGSLHQGNAIRQLRQGPMLKDLGDKDFALCLRLMKSYRECGHLGWYDWNIANWGTKWNAYKTDLVSDSVLEFQTAWSTPRPVIDELAKRVGGKLKHEWADEDTGNNVGWVTYEDGVAADCAELSDTKEGYELAFDLHGDKDEWEWNGNTYVYVEDE